MNPNEAIVFSGRCRDKSLGTLTVTCAPKGRLGNRMFQVAACLGYAHKSGLHRPVFDRGTLAPYDGTVFRRLTFEDSATPIIHVNDTPEFTHPSGGAGYRLSRNAALLVAATAVHAAAYEDWLVLRVLTNVGIELQSDS